MNGEDIAHDIAGLLGRRTVATAESVTCGRVVQALGCVDDASDFLRGAVVAYQEATKRKLLDVAAPDIVSAQAATEMCIGVADLLHADVTVATTGLAGTEPQDGQPGGTVFIATRVDGEARVRQHHFDGAPQQVCDDAARQALVDLLAHLRSPRSGAGSAGESKPSSMQRADVANGEGDPEPDTQFAERRTRVERGHDVSPSPGQF